MMYANIFRFFKTIILIVLTQLTNFNKGLPIRTMGAAGWELSSKYRSSHPLAAKLEKAFNAGEKLYPKFEVKALRFTDGTVLQ
jgi:hypothetical protein